jgi:2-dehydro-3-deoxygalactonokinase
MMQNDKRQHTLICVDAGTTNTRVWLTRDGEILAKRQATVGVRDTARDGSNERLQQALRDLIADVRSGTEDDPPACVIAAGMITSPLGLAEVPHVPAPAGTELLARSTTLRRFPAVTELPVYLIPGVRVGPLPCDLETVTDADVIRGEETLCVGMNATGKLGPGGALLNLGSHWKVIKIDQTAKIVESVTSMAGELIHTTQTQTILADAVPQERPAELDPAWLDAGMREQRRSGLARALFCIRLLHQRSDGTADQRFAYLIGAYLASDLDALSQRGIFSPKSQVSITGGGPIAAAWKRALDENSISSSLINEQHVETAMLAGFSQIAKSILFQD